MLRKTITHCRFIYCEVAIIISCYLAFKNCMSSTIFYFAYFYIYFRIWLSLTTHWWLRITIAHRNYIFSYNVMWQIRPLYCWPSCINSNLSPFAAKASLAIYNSHSCDSVLSIRKVILHYILPSAIIIGSCFIYLIAIVIDFNYWSSFCCSFNKWSIVIW